MTIERGLNDAPLHAAPAAVDEPHLSQPRRRGGVHIFRHYRGDVARSEGMEIELGFDRNAKWIGQGRVRVYAGRS